MRNDRAIPYAAAPTSAAEARSARARGARHLLLAAGLCVVCFASVAPFLGLFEFSNGGENAVVASVQEIHRGGRWLVPTLHEEQRTKKPPLATWLSALATRPETVARQSDLDPAVRAAAFRAFGWQARWPALLAMCGVVAATYALGALTGGPRLGLVSALVCASSFFWIRNARMATTDAHLALWVSVANCLLAAAVLDRRHWLGLVGAGAALGLAMMSKGPVALLQAVLPVVVFLAWRRWWRQLALWCVNLIGRVLARFGRRPQWWGGAAGFNPQADVDRSLDDVDAPLPADAAPLPPRGWVAPLLAGVLLFVAIGFTWYLLVFLNNPEVVAEWKKELTREGATGLPPSKPYAYAGLVYILFPWCFFFVAGLIGASRLAVRGSATDESAHRGAGERGGRIVLPLLMLLLPIGVMSFFRDRELRYLIPLLAPASVVIAFAVLQLLTAPVRRRGTTAMIVGLHWLPLLVITVVLPLVASPVGREAWIDGPPWYSLRAAIVASEVFLVLVVTVAVLQRLWPVGAVVGGTALVMLAWGVVLNAGYRHSREGRSEMRPLAERILTTYPDATVYSLRPDRPVRKAPIDLSIYLNRVVENIGAVVDMESTSGPRVLLIRHKLGQPAPPPPAGWTLFAEAPNDDAVWHAYAPPPSAALPTGPATTAAAGARAPSE